MVLVLFLSGVFPSHYLMYVDTSWSQRPYSKFNWRIFLFVLLIYHCQANRSPQLLLLPFCMKIIVGSDCMSVTLWRSWFSQFHYIWCQVKLNFDLMILCLRTYKQRFVLIFVIWLYYLAWFRVRVATATGSAAWPVLAISSNLAPHRHFVPNEKGDRRFSPRETLLN